MTRLDGHDLRTLFYI